MTTYVRRTINNDEVVADRQIKNYGKIDKVISDFSSETKTHKKVYSRPKKGSRACIVAAQSPSE
jgi:hypothetical protein